MIRKNSYFLRVGLLGMIGKFVIDQITIEMLSGNSIEAVNKTFQSAVVGVHTLNVIESKGTDFYSIKSLIDSQCIIGSCTVSTKNRTLGDVTADDSGDAIIRSLTKPTNLGDGQT